ncbi:glycine betaine ABC transporter substrate-binding protein [Staphylococcus durrellii]|uniref:glycine betaine ABC transporter substrate-binding protein n=1 Tax=Staphylococcus durrellii TaxID=2781773 RepID=UPI00189F5AD2|nr:glycine betaine ABC transporter substrate-binding protein [Staphylococcus durrellii]MBF7015957.1 ABC transporter substrate-binding protein [Staphylococcus durrellii]
MIKRRLIKMVGLVATLALALVLSACGNGGGSSDNKKTALGSKDVEIPYIASDNSTARSLVIAEVLKKAGYNVTTTPVQASGPLYASVSEDKNQFHADGIFPSTDKKYYDKFKNKVTVYNQNHIIDKAKVGLAVPKYEQDVDSIRDLKNKDFGKSVDWTIQGTDERNGIMKQTKDEIGENDLKKYSLKKSSDQDQFKKIQGAYKQQKPIVFTAMDPSWINKELDFKMLEDPDKVYGNKDQHIDLVFNKEFKQNHPGAYKIATRMADDWSKKDEENLSKKIFVDNKNPEQTAKDYVDDHDNKVDDWTENVGN